MRPYGLLESDFTNSFYDGVTPILTLLWNATTVNAEAYLSCLKMAESTNGEVGGTLRNGNSTTRSGGWSVRSSDAALY